MLRHVTHYYFINYVKGLFPRVSEAHCVYTSLHKYVTTIRLVPFARGMKFATQISPLLD